MNKHIYLDNAATTPLAPEVLAAMLPYLKDSYGNPSSVHSLGRESRMALETARKDIGARLGVAPGTLCFTSGGTEANNMAIALAVRDLGCTHLITSRLEHHAVLHTMEHYAFQHRLGISYVDHQEEGSLNLTHLRRLLKEKSAEGHRCLVSLLHANNETGQITEPAWVSSLCRRYRAVFHADCVVTTGHFALNLDSLGADLVSASAHKFHGPKGAGFLYIRQGRQRGALLYGGGQERGRRAGTENTAAIVGMACALRLASERMREDQVYISGMKSCLASGLRDRFPGVVFNSGRFSVYTILSASFPKTEASEGLLTELDGQGICVAGGSACSGGGSHVMEALGRSKDYVTLRFSFSRYNTLEEMARVLGALQGILRPFASTACPV